MDFIKFPKIPRLNRECMITEKIDGTNASIFITSVIEALANGWGFSGQEIIRLSDNSIILAASRNRWLSSDKDNYGFFKWVNTNREELVKLGPGLHRGEWWGYGIQKRYNETLKKAKKTGKMFTLFNTWRWRGEDEESTPPECCSVVPVLYQGPFHSKAAKDTVQGLRDGGSVICPGAEAEGIVVFHVAANSYFKVTLDNDEMPKGAT